MFKFEEILGLDSISTLISLAQDQGLGSETEDGDSIADCGSVQVLNPGDGGMTGDEAVYFGLELAPELQNLTDDELGACTVEDDSMSDRELKYNVLKVLKAQLKAEEKADQARLCPDEDFDHDVSPSLYMGVDRDDLARVVELQLFIAGRQETVDFCQATLDSFATSPVARPVFMRWVEAKKHAINQKLQAISVVQEVAGQRGESYRKALWFSFFQIEDLESWMADYQNENLLNRNMVKGDVDPEIDNAMLKSENLNRGDDLSADHNREMVAELAVVNAPLREYEELRKCNCRECQAQRNVTQEAEGFNAYLQSLTREQEEAMHVSVYA